MKYVPCCARVIQGISYLVSFDKVVAVIGA